MKDLKYIAGEISKGKNLDINLEKLFGSEVMRDLERIIMLKVAVWSFTIRLALDLMPHINERMAADFKVGSRIAYLDNISGSIRNRLRGCKWCSPSRGSGMLS